MFEIFFMIYLIGIIVFMFLTVKHIEQCCTGTIFIFYLFMCLFWPIVLGIFIYYDLLYTRRIRKFRKP